MTLYFWKKGRSQQFQTVSPGKGAAAMQCYSLPFKEGAAKLLKCYYSSPKLISPLAVQIHVKCYFTRQAMPTNSLKSLPRKTCFSSGRLLSKMAANVIKLEDTWWKMKQPEMLLSGGRTLALVFFGSDWGVGYWRAVTSSKLISVKWLIWACKWGQRRKQQVPKEKNNFDELIKNEIKLKLLLRLFPNSQTLGGMSKYPSQADLSALWKHRIRLTKFLLLISDVRDNRSESHWELKSL